MKEKSNKSKEKQKVSTKSALVKMKLSENAIPKSDLHRIRAMTNKDIQDGIDKDRDAAPISIDWPKNAKVSLSKNKIAISLRIDQDVLAFYKNEGPGYLSVMNAVLRAYMQSCHAQNK